MKAIEKMGSCLKVNGEAIYGTRPREGDLKIYMLGWIKPLEWKYNKATGLEISLPTELQDDSNRPCKSAWSFRIVSLN
jgi:hypothetical protein